MVGGSSHPGYECWEGQHKPCCKQFPHIIRILTPCNTRHVTIIFHGILVMNSTNKLVRKKSESVKWGFDCTHKLPLSASPKYVCTCVRKSLQIYTVYLERLQESNTQLVGVFYLHLAGSVAAATQYVSVYCARRPTLEVSWVGGSDLKIFFHDPPEAPLVLLLLL